MKIRNLLRRLVYPNRYSSEAYVKYLRNKGINVGKNVEFFDPTRTNIDVTRPYLISIGDYCKITSDVIILSHDYSKSVLRLKYKEIIGEAGMVNIGNNVFIGMNSIVLRGVKIGNNVIIGACSVVTHNIPDDVVVAGNPAKVVMTLWEYYEKRKKNTLSEAKEYAKNIFAITGRKPTVKELDGFYPLFIRRDIAELKKNKLTIDFSGDEYEDVVDGFLNSKSVYESFEDFLEDCGIQEKKLQI